MPAPIFAEDQVLAGYVSLIVNVLGLPSNCVYSDLPDLPYQGAWPLVIVTPLTQVDERISQGLVQGSGFYRIHYFDRLPAQSGQSKASVMHDARRFALAVRRALRRDPTLGGACEWAGERRGIVTRYGAAGPISTELSDQPLYLLPIDVDTLAHADLEEVSNDLTGLNEAQYP